MSMIQTIEVIQRKVELNVELTVVIRPVAYYTKKHKCGFVHLFFLWGGNVNVDPTGKIFKVHVTRSVCFSKRGMRSSSGQRYLHDLHVRTI